MASALDLESGKSTPQTPLLADRLVQSNSASSVTAITEVSEEKERSKWLATEEEMLREEAKQCQTRLRGWHTEEQNLRKDIGLAFSGGGTRAAAFHCGVLWAMADAGILKNMMHLSATSGGGYTSAAFMTHLHQMTDEAEQATSLDDWYKQVVMRCVLRMQHNINYIVDANPERLFRMPKADPLEDGTSCQPRIFDLPFFIMALLGGIAAPAMILLIHTMWPVVLHIELWHGTALRGIWCDPAGMPLDNPEFKHWKITVLSIIAFLSCAWLLLNLFCSGSQTNLGTLTCRSLRVVLGRFVILYTVYVFLVVLVLWLQVHEWGSAGSGTSEERAYVRALCYRYVAASSGLPMPTEAGPNPVGGGPICSDLPQTAIAGHPGAPAWCSFKGPDLYLNATWAAERTVLPEGAQWNEGHPLKPRESKFRSFWQSDLYRLAGTAGFVVVSVILILIFAQILQLALTIMVPTGYVFIIASVARWKVFGPITGQALLFSDSTQYSQGFFTFFCVVCCVGAMLTLPFYDVIGRLMHLYYRRSLKKAFFYRGRDISAAAMAANPYCPNFILGASIVDYQPIGAASNFCDFMISTSFVGCRRTGFFYTPAQHRLAHLMTMAGAGPDAAMLVSQDGIFIRFLLAVLSLRFGDFLRLESDGETAVRVSERIRVKASRVTTVVEKAADRAAGKVSALAQCTPLLQRRLDPGAALAVSSLKEALKKADKHWFQRSLQGLLDRLPTAIPFFIAQLALLVGALSEGTDTTNCKSYRAMLVFAFAILDAVIMFSFFSHFRCLKFLTRSPMIQQFHMMVMHKNAEPEPPPYLYVSDGGLLEVLGILPLLKRRLKRIVVSDAAEDPNLTMRCLRETVVIVQREHLCSFYDPAEPGRDLEFVLLDFARGNKAWLHLGIRYEREPSLKFGEEIGELFYVRMRLLPNDHAPVRGLLTEAELLGPPPTDGAQSQAVRPEESSWARAPKRGDLGGTCYPWCECGGFVKGRRFPHFSMSHQFLTPLHFANLCGLAAELTQPLMCRMLDREAGIQRKPERHAST